MAISFWKVAAGVLLAALVLSSYGTLYYYGQFTNLSSENDALRRELGDVGVKVNLVVDFGNGTRIWYNDTVVPIGSSVFNATSFALKGNLAYQVYHSAGLSGVFVTAILGVTSDSSTYWLWYTYDAQAGNWTELAVGADQYVATNGGVYSWVYTKAI